MAATLTADQELVHFSFPIEKREDTETVNPVDGTPDLLILGKATDGTIDGDGEIVDPVWSADAIQRWATKGNIRMSHDPKRPIGKGREVQVTSDGHWVKALICDPLAKHFIRNGVLNDFSVGISNPGFRYSDRNLDPEGKARRIITGKQDGTSEISEISVCDRGSNFNSSFQIVRKSAGDGDGSVLVGAMVGDEAEIAKAAPAALLTKVAAGTADDDPDGTVTVDIPKTATVTFSPEDLRKLLAHRAVAEQREAGNHTLKVIAEAEAPVYKRDIDTATRKRLAAQRRALPDGSYPVETHEDADNAVTLALSGHGDVAAAKSMLRRIAREEGWQDILDRLDGKPARAGKPAKPKKAKSAEGLHAADYVFPETRTFQIVTPQDVPAAVKAWGTYQGSRSWDDFRRLLCRKARDKGEEFADELPQDWKTKRELQRAIAKASAGDAMPTPPDGPDRAQGTPAGSAGQGAAKTASTSGDSDAGGPLHHQDGQDDDPDTEADTMDKAAAAIAELRASGLGAEAIAALAAEKAARPDVAKPPKVTCPSCGKKCKASSRFCPSCGKPVTAEKSAHPVPDSATGEDGRIDPAPEHREPDGPAVEMLERDAHIEDGDEAAELRAAAARKSQGIPYDAAWLHDLLCPAYEPPVAKACHPHAGLALLDETAWQARALEAAASAPLEHAREAALLWQHAATVKALPADLADELTAEAHKAFRDANPGPGRAPVPGEIPASRFSRPYITGGHAAPSPGHDAPNTAPVHPGHISAADFQRPFLQAGHAADSPGNPDPRPSPVPAPPLPGVPSRVYYTNVQRDNARQAMTAMHDHIARTFPDVCPMHGPGHMGEPGAGARPVPAGVGAPVPHGPGGPAASKAADGETAGQGAPRTERLPRRKQMKRLAKAVLSGDITVDAAREQMGLTPFTVQPDVLKASASAFTADPGLIKTAVTEATATLAAEFKAALEQRDAAHAADMKRVIKALKKQDVTLDAIASQPDPAVTAYRSVAMTAAPRTPVPLAGEPVTVAKRAEHAQAAVFNAMVDQWRNHEDPEMREAAHDVLLDMMQMTPGAHMRT